jgi:hypothetical protein
MNAGHQESFTHCSCFFCLLSLLCLLVRSFSFSVHLGLADKAEENAVDPTTWAYLRSVASSEMDPVAFRDLLWGLLRGGGLVPPNVGMINTNDTFLFNSNAAGLLASQTTMFFSGIPANFSGRYLLKDCTAAVFSVPETILANISAQFEDIAALSNGNCGSSCANFINSVMFSGKVTVVTVGGLPDNPMDPSGFNGGNIAHWDSTWPQIAAARASAEFLAAISNITLEPSSLIATAFPLNLNPSFTMVAVP